MSHSLRSTGQARAVVADKREAILKAAVKVFARKGFFNSKVADVAGEAGTKNCRTASRKTRRRP
ncbi:MAG: TetR family transcriptional regulator [Acidobacteria bacterium]|nr:TetR family transcriptional regulator [Acidobacteriota bacterium]